MSSLDGCRGAVVQQSSPLIGWHSLIYTVYVSAVQGKTAELAIVAEREVDFPGNKAKFTLTELNDATERLADPNIPLVSISKHTTE